MASLLEPGVKPDATGLHAIGKGYLLYEHEDPVAFDVQGIDQTQAILRILCPRAPREVLLGGQPLAADRYQYQGRSLAVHFVNTAVPQPMRILF